MIFTRKMPEFHIIGPNWPKNIFPNLFFFWGGDVSPCPARLLRLCFSFVRLFVTLTLVLILISRKVQIDFSGFVGTGGYV